MRQSSFKSWRVITSPEESTWILLAFLMGTPTNRLIGLLGLNCEGKDNKIMYNVVTGKPLFSNHYRAVNRRLKHVATYCDSPSWKKHWLTWNQNEEKD